ncbi:MULTISPECIES: hypothetical protein [unclassified Minwuia]|uniref:hypothetical protein n=1 Tax=unclassified Minwuia TaxID=2618799 RepID=UPI0024799840|nr:MULTISPECIES: hypothetical protein [unclassified Minwuia]
MEQILETTPSWEATGRSIIAIVYLLGVVFVYSLARASGRVGFFWLSWSGYDDRKSRAWHGATRQTAIAIGSCGSAEVQELQPPSWHSTHLVWINL